MGVGVYVLKLDLPIFFNRKMSSRIRWIFLDMLSIKIGRREESGAIHLVLKLAPFKPKIDNEWEVHRSKATEGEKQLHHPLHMSAPCTPMV